MSGKLAGFLGGFGIGLCLGAGLMYYLDPDQGRRRRALARDQAVHLTHETEHIASRKARHIGNRVRGVAATFERAVRPQRTVGRRRSTTN